MRIKPTFLCLLIFLSFTLVQCKTSALGQKDYRKYYPEVYKADSLSLAGKHESSFNILDSLFRVYEPTNFPPYYEYETYLKASYLSRKNISKKKVKSLIVNYGFDTETFDTITYPVLNKVFEESNISKEKYQKLRKKYLTKIDTSLRRKILQLNYFDQKARRTDISEENRFKLKDSIGSESEKFLMDLFSRNIFPNEKVIGNHTIDKNPSISINVLLLHTRDSIRLNYFIPKINSFVEQGQCLPSIYYQMIDQYQLYNDKEQIYGTYNFNRLNPKEYSAVRKKAGLPSLEYLKWKFKMLIGGS